MNTKHVILLMLYCFSLVDEVLADNKGVFEYEWDAYYSNVSWVKGLADQEIPEIKSLKELDIYKKILQESLTPDFLLLEASVNPFPILGTYLRDKKPSFYDANGRGKGVEGKLIEGVTSGFEEPYALSLFAGRVIRFVPPEGMETKGDNKGYIGYLLSVGNQHIQKNKLIDDNWVELEWKIKGKRETELQYLSWSMRLGAKFHEHSEISNTFMIGVRRDRIDFQVAETAFMRDLSFEYRFEVLQHSLKPSRQLFIVDKHWPLYHDQYTFSLGAGVIWQGEDRYTGNLAVNQDKWLLVFRPNFKF